MEHRWHSRDPAHFDVVLYHQGVPVARGAAQNLSANGMLIEPATDNLDINACIELEFCLKERGAVHRYRVGAQVVHQSGAGTGVMFQSHRPETRAVISKLLETCRAASLAAP